MNARLLSCVLALTAASVSAVTPDTGPGASPQGLTGPLIEQPRRLQAPPELAARWQAAVGGDWQLAVDARSGRLALAIGGPRLFAPERLESLGVRELETELRRVLAATRELHGLTDAELRLTPERVVRSHEGRVWALGFERLIYGLPLEAGGLTAGIARGRLAYLRFDRNLEPPARQQPRLGAVEAERVARVELGLADTAKLAAEPRLVWQLSQRADGDRLRLSWRLDLEQPGTLERWRVWIDALDGEPVARQELTLYVEGEVNGWVRGRRPDEPEQLEPLGNHRVVVGGEETVTDLGGRYQSAGEADVVFELHGPLDGGGFVVDNLAGPSALVESQAAPVVDLTWDDANSRADERSTFYHLNRARQQAVRQHPFIPWFREIVPASVNYQASCNAAWDGNGVLFMREGCQRDSQTNEIVRCCNNTGENADVIIHEWGHGVDARHGGIADATSSEAIGDITAFCVSRQPLIAPGFNQPGWLYGPLADPSALRDVSEPITAENVSRRCPLHACRGPLGYLCHCEALVFSGAVWDLRGLMEHKLGVDGSWDYVENLHYLAMASWSNYLEAMDLFLFYDDGIYGDGLLVNGTPHGCVIERAFEAHGIAGRPTSCSEPWLELELAAVGIDDGTTGDADGSLDAGESVELRLRLRNLGDAVAEQARVTLSSPHPAVTLTGEALFGQIAAASLTDGLEPLPLLSVAEDVACGELLPLELRIEADGWSFEQRVELRVGRPYATLWSQDFELDDGGFVGDAGDAAEGAWLVGEPTPTVRYGSVFQPEGCATGSGCYYTGQSPTLHDRTRGDVDAGEALALGPELELTGVDRPVLDYRLWFVSYDIARQPEDRFELRLLTDDTAELLAEVAQSRAAWVGRSADLTSAVAGPQPVRLGFAALDLPDEGPMENVVEAAIDDLRLRAFSCELDVDCATSRPRANALRAVKAGAGLQLVWELERGEAANLHRTQQASELPELWQRQSTRLGSAAEGLEDTEPPAGLVLYRVHGQDCNGHSLAR